MAQVQVYVNEYIDAEVEIAEYLGEVKTKDLEDELRTRKDSSFYQLPVRTFEQLHTAARAQMEKNKNTARIFLCDILRLNYYVSTDELLTEIKSRIE